MPWAIDFQHDSTDKPQPFRSVSLVDEHTRESMADHTAVSITGEDVIALLEATAADRGTYPLVLRADNGPEFICHVVAEWAKDKVGLAFIPPGQPWRNGYVESFHARQRDECLNITVFGTVAEAAVRIRNWHWEYNNVRRHSALGYKTPAEYAALCTHRR
jgi:transposase InsO family protein